MPVIEEGTYDEVKECVFQVLALWCFDVMMEDLMTDFANAGFESRSHNMLRRWSYTFRPNPDCDRPTVTEVEVTFWRTNRGTPNDVYHLLEHLSMKYGFRYDKVTYDGRIQRLSINRGDPMHGNLYFQNSPEELSLRLLFPLWR